MNRKEIIVFSVLVNTGLLVALFIFALRPTLKGEMNMDSNEVVIVNETAKASEISSSELDQVDQILKEYIAKAEHPNKIEPVKEVKKTETIAAVPAKAPVKKESSPLVEVIVRQGDVLEKIARRHHTTVEEIMDLNKMKDTRLRIGQILYLRENTRKKVAVSKNTATPNKESAKQFYTVKNGDSPWTIAIKNHIKVSELLRLNNLNEAKAKRLKPGDKLRIR